MSDPVRTRALALDAAATQNVPVAGTAAIAWPERAVAGVLALLAVVPYLNTLLNAFVYDDNTQVMNNPYIQNFSHLRQIFSTTVWSYVGTQGVTNYYRPMMTFGYLLCYKLFGGAVAYGFHLANIALHAAVVCVLYKVTERMVKERAWAFIAAALFALHPVHIESVAWIAAVTDLELTLFYLLAFAFFLKLARPEGGRSPLALAGMTVAFVLALCSKEQALTLPALATLYEHFYRDDRRETRWAEKLARYQVLWLLAFAYLLFRVRFFGALAPVKQISNLTRTEALFSGLALVGQYGEKLVWPAHLCAFYVFHRSTTIFDPRVLGGVGVLALVAVLFVVLWRRERVASFGIIWLLVTLAPVLNAQYMAANVFAERYLYLPSVGFAWIVGLGAVRLWQAASRAGSRRHLGRTALAGGAVAVAAVCVARIVVRNRDWRNDVTLYTQTLAVQPDAYPIRNNLGTVYWKQGNDDSAEREWRIALEANPTNAIVLNNLGLVMSKKKRYPEAIAFFHRAIARKPNYTDPHLNLGSTLLDTGQTAAAELQLRAAVALSPLNTSARNELGKLYLEQDKLIEAAGEFHASAASEPNPVAYDALGDIAMRRPGADSEAEADYRQALALSPFDSHAHFSLGAIYAAAGRNQEALKEYKQGLETDPRDAAALAAVKRLASRSD